MIELLIVTVVIVTLMGIVFRLAGVGGDSRAKSTTFSRLQRIENAISGYYAAFGSYPPVPLQGRSRDYRVKVDDNGVQGPPGDITSVNLASPTEETVKQVDAACRAQPIAVLFPFYSNDYSDKKNELDKKLINNMASELKLNFSYGPYTNPGGFNRDSADWQDIELFQFGLLSFLLPRYQFMLRGDSNLYKLPQWTENNQLPCRIDKGRSYDSWEKMQKDLFSQGGNVKDAMLIESLPSQAVCARWMPNFEGIITGGLYFYGVNTSESDWPYLSGSLYKGVPGYKTWMRQASQRGYKNSGSLYLLDGMTIADGWGNEFYYYSEVPYQSYRLWSAGPNRRTFPPWADLENIDGGKAALKTIANWTKDDVSHLTN